MDIKIISPISGLAIGIIFLFIFLASTNYNKTKRMYLSLFLAEVANFATWYIITMYYQQFDIYTKVLIAQASKIVVLTITLYLLSSRQIKLYKTFLLSLFFTLGSLSVLFFITNITDYTPALIISGLIIASKLIGGWIYLTVSKQKKVYLLSIITANILILPLIFIFSLETVWHLGLFFLGSLIVESFIIYIHNKTNIIYKRAWNLTLLANSPLFILMLIIILFYLLNNFLIAR